MPYQMGATEGTLANVTAQIELNPRATYAPGVDRRPTLSGTLSYRGYARATWTWEALSLIDWGTLKDTLAGGGHSDECYIQTRNDEDTYTNYRAIARLPNPAELERWGGHYLNVTVEFILLEELT